MHRNHSTSKRSNSPIPVYQRLREDSQLNVPPKVDGCGMSKEPTVPPPPAMPSFLKISYEEMRQKYEQLTAIENARLEAAEIDPDANCKWARLHPDRTLDRYANISPWAKNRIHLEVPDGYNDYINASPVTLTSTSEKQSDLKPGIQDKYICMQGPKKQTVDHTWHMLWHSISVPDNAAPGVIIMLSPTIGPNPNDPSKMMEKCYQYYPHDADSPPLRINESLELGGNFKATVRFVSREDNVQDTAIEVRKLAMSVEGEDEEKIIWHFLYPLWPDFGALDAKNIDSILTLMKLTRIKNTNGENPRVVHCSAGVGRTGTFVALEFLIGELHRGAWEGWDEKDTHVTDPIYETVDQLRMQRKTMVQAFEQYVFLYEVLKKMWEEKYLTPCMGGEHMHNESVTLPEPPAKSVKR